jgi:hypothetical protein
MKTRVEKSFRLHSMHEPLRACCYICQQLPMQIAEKKKKMKLSFFVHWIERLSQFNVKIGLRYYFSTLKLYLFIYFRGIDFGLLCMWFINWKFSPSSFRKIQFDKIAFRGETFLIYHAAEKLLQVGEWTHTHAHNAMIKD